MSRVNQKLALFLTVSLFFAACNKGSSGYQSSTTTQPPPPTDPSKISISGMSFGGDVTVKAGTKVTWTNNDAMNHTVTANDGSFDSGAMGQGATFSFTFTNKGTFAYFCQYHSSMKASIIVN